MIRSALVSAALLLSVPATAQVTIGSFSGAIEPAPGTKLRLALHLSKALEGDLLVGTMDSLDQGARGMGIGRITATGDTLRYAAPAIGASYEGKWDAASKSWVGTWTQGGQAFPLTWTPVASPARPPLPAIADWTMPAPDAALASLVADRPKTVIAAATIDKGKVASAVRGGAETKAGPTTRFEIGSITKVFTDLLLADMVARGEVKFDDPVSRYLPAGTLPDHGNRPITLRDLATHYSGLPRLPVNLTPADPLDPYATYDQASLHAGLKQWTPMRPPGAMFEYSNLGVGLLGQALAARAGKPYEELLAERILRPLGMEQTDFTDTGLAIPISEKGAAVKPWRLASLAGAGGLRSTIGDMSRFAAAFLDPPARLRPAFRLLLAEPLRPAGGFSRIGLGVLSVPTTQGPLLNHDGGTGGMRSSLYVDPARGRAVVVLSNDASGPNPRDIGVELIAGVKPQGAAR